jgi:hypothetical protein
MYIDRSIINRVFGNEELDDGYIDADSADLFAMVWDIKTRGVPKIFQEKTGIRLPQ